MELVEQKKSGLTSDIINDGRGEGKRKENQEKTDEGDSMSGTILGDLVKK